MRAPLAERLIERLAEGDADVLGGVVLVDVQVALGAHGQVEARVARQAVEHVVEEADAGGDVAVTRAVQVEHDLDAALARLAADVSGARRQAARAA